MFPDLHSIEAYLVITLVVALIVTLYKSWLSTAFSFLVIITTLLLTGILSPSDALHGFANEQLAVIVLLLILSGILQKSPAVNAIFRKTLRKNDKPKTFLTKMMTLVGVNSAFFNNTPLVAMMIPYVFNWSKENNISPSKFLIPLSYASILGGLVTLVGTSTTLIVNALAVQNGVESLGMFDLTIVGLPMLLIGIVYLTLFGNKLLPDRRINTTYQDKQQQVREYFMETKVKAGSPIIGKTVSEAKLRQLEKFFLVELLRGNKAFRPVNPEEIIEEHDILFFAGDIEGISNMDFEALGLSLPKNCETSTGRRHDMTEVVISHNSALIGRDIRQSNFRSKYDSAVLAIHRNGERVWGQLGRVKLKAGDVLLLMAGKNFGNRIKENNDLYQISNKKYEEEPDIRKIITIFGGMIGAIVLSSFPAIDLSFTGMDFILKPIPLFNSLVILLIISFLSGLTTVREIKNSIDYNLVLIIGLGLALGKAMENSGASLLISELISSIADPKHIWIFFIWIFIITNLLSSIITSKAAVAILIPILLIVTSHIGIPPKPVILLIAFASAANFITPFGYQTNLMVFGPGRYRFTDFVKIGAPLTIIYMFVCVFILVYTYNL